MAVAVRTSTRVHRAARAVLDVLLPPRCLCCGDSVGDLGTLCGACWGRLGFLAPPLCARCGFPFDYDPGGDAECGECLRQPPDYDRARAVLRYDEHSRDLVIAFKHRDRTDAAPAYGKWMVRAGAELVGDAELVVPVPLHRYRLIARRFNQSAELARAISLASGVPCAPDVLVRTRSTPSQGRLSRSERARNVRGAFAVRPRGRERISGRRVILIDDVLTTGATASSCARALLRGGAAAVDVLTLARVVRPAR